MRVLKTAIFLSLILLSIIGKSQSIVLASSPRIEARYRFEDDTSLLNLLERWTAIAGYEFTFSGVHELPLISELKTIEAVLYREAIEKALGAYKNHNLSVVLEARIDDEKKHLYLVTSKTPEKPKTNIPITAMHAGFSATENDKSMMQVFVRWASQSGYQSFINNEPVNLQVFPRHVNRYPDYSLITPAKTFKTQSKLKDAISQFIALYTGISLDPFTVRVDEENKRLYIVSLVRY